MFRLNSLIQRLINSPALTLLKRPEYKRIKITAYLSVVCVLIALVYWFVDLSSGVLYSSPAYAFLLLNAMAVIFFLRRGRFTLAKVLLAITINLVVFYASITDPFESGTFILYVSTGVASFAILGFQERIKSYYLAAFTSLLFLIAYATDIDLGNTIPPDSYVRLSFIVNYVIAIISAVLVLYFLVELNNESEGELMNKERAVTEKNKQLTKVNQELDRFVYSVSHDLRSPLTSIMGIINLAKYAGTREELMELVQRIEGRVQAQEKFIDEIISYSRNSRMRVERVRVSLTEVVNEVLESLRYLPGFGGIDFRIEDNDKLQLLVDRTRLKVILLNLISNAIKYHDPARPDPFVIVSLKEEKRYLSIHVRDNGLGIAQEHLHKIFDMFYRASEKSTGSGLGLYIAQEVIEKMGGTLSVKSKPGEGTTFIVRLRA